MNPFLYRCKCRDTSIVSVYTVIYIDGHRSMEVHEYVLYCARYIGRRAHIHGRVPIVAFHITTLKIVISPCSSVKQIPEKNTLCQIPIYDEFLAKNVVEAKTLSLYRAGSIPAERSPKHFSIVAWSTMLFLKPFHPTVTHRSRGREFGFAMEMYYSKNYS